MNDSDSDRSLTRSSSKRSGNAAFVFAAVTICLASLAIFFREFLESGFNLIAGDIGDNRFCIAILEHWIAVGHRQASLTSPNFFWPEHGVLGYSESLFLFSLPYAFASGAGADHYVAFELALILFKAVGFGSMLWLLRLIGVSPAVAIIGSCLFTVSNLYFISEAHGHLIVVAFVPLLASLGCAAWRAYGRGQRVSGCVYAGLLGLLLALVLFTSFYIGWFTVLAGGVGILVAAILNLLEVGDLSPWRYWIRATVVRGPMLATAGLAFSVGIVPFLNTYLPVLKTTGGRTFQEVLTYSPHPIDIINVGEKNWMWGHSLNAFMAYVSNRSMMPAEIQRGWPPITISLIVAGTILGLWRRNRIQTPPGQGYGFLALVLSVSFVVCWILTLNIDGRSFWWVALNLIPGGSAIRVPARFNLVLNVFVVTVACIVLNKLKDLQGRASGVAFGLVSVLLIAEQINSVPVHLIRRDSENAIFMRTHRPPLNCTSFYLYPSGRERPFYANQIDAMLIARMYSIPTLNGYSGWVPTGWEFPMFDEFYQQNVRGWAFTKNVTAGLCTIDLRDGSWRTADVTVAPYFLGSTIDFHKGGNASLYELEGWAGAEDGGTWTVGAFSTLLLNLPAPPSSDLTLTFRAHAFVPPQRPTFHEQLLVNNSEVLAWSVTDQQSQIEKKVHVSRSVVDSRLVRIEFRNRDPRSPAELGISIDGRRLSLALEKIEVSQSSL